MTVLGLRFCTRAFSSCGKRGPLFIAVRRPLTIAASLVAEHRLQTRRLSNCGSRAQSLHSMWDLPRPGLKPVSPALAGRFSTTAPPGKPVFEFCQWFPLLYKSFKFNQILFVWFCFLFLLPQETDPKNIAMIYVKECSAYVLFQEFQSFRSYIQVFNPFHLGLQPILRVFFFFVYGARECSNYIDLHVAVQCSQNHLAKRLSFLHCIFLPPLSQIN